MSLCANCGKGEEVGMSLKVCTACKLVKYCSRECQIAHRSQHKRECKKRAKELHDEKLFKQPPPLDDCPICMIRLPILGNGRVYMACCGKMICRGCTHAFQSRAAKAVSKAVQRKKDVCPFCRTPAPVTIEEGNMRDLQRVELNDATAMYNLGLYHRNGDYGFPQNHVKALELWHRAGELGNAQSYYAIGNVYKFGEGGVEVDEKKAIYYWGLAAIGGDPYARNNLGVIEANLNNMDRALKHCMITVRIGVSNSLENIKLMFKNGDATRDDYSKALRSYQAHLDEIKSVQRDEAAAFKDEWKYY